MKYINLALIDTDFVASIKYVNPDGSETYVR